MVSRLTVFYIPLYFFDVLFLEAARETILERFLLATIHLVFFTAVVKMFSARSTRDYVYLAALAFALMLAAATLTVQTSFLLYFALFLLLAIMTFTSLEIKRSRARSRPACRAP
jgi:chromate transport protein ChrA